MCKKMGSLYDQKVVLKWDEFIILRFPNNFIGFGMFGDDIASSTHHEISTYCQTYHHNIKNHNITHIIDNNVRIIKKFMLVISSSITSGIMSGRKKN